jgi:hypothetical protein
MTTEANDQGLRTALTNRITGWREMAAQRYQIIDPNFYADGLEEVLAAHPPSTDTALRERLEVAIVTNAINGIVGKAVPVDVLNEILALPPGTPTFADTLLARLRKELPPFIEKMPPELREPFQKIVAGLWEYASLPDESRLLALERKRVALTKAWEDWHSTDEGALSQALIEAINAFVDDPSGEAIPEPHESRLEEAEKVIDAIADRQKYVPNQAAHDGYQSFIDWANDYRAKYPRPNQQPATCGLPCGTRQSCILPKGHEMWCAPVLPEPPAPEASADARAAIVESLYCAITAIGTTYQRKYLTEAVDKLLAAVRSER